MIRKPTTIDDEPLSLLPHGVYAALKAIAAAQLSQETQGHTLQPTALVHEAFLSLCVSGVSAEESDPDHFLATATQAMRHILVDHARRKRSLKRGGTRGKEQLVDLPDPGSVDPAILLAVHDALVVLDGEDPLCADFVRLRVFSGFTHSEAAARLKINRSKADRVWAYAKSRLCVLIDGSRKAVLPR